MQSESYILAINCISSVGTLHAKKEKGNRGQKMHAGEGYTFGVLSSEMYSLIPSNSVFIYMVQAIKVQGMGKYI